MRKIKILIVDDDTMVRIGLKSIINWEEQGFLLVGEASDGVSALELVENTHPDIIITDMKMPRMDGLEFMRNLVKKKNRAEVIVLSSYDEFSLVKEAMKLGARDYLLKLNLDPQEFIQCIQQVAENLTESEEPTESVDSEKNLTLLQKDFLWKVISNVYFEKNHWDKAVKDLEIHLDQRPVYAMVLKAGELYRFEDATPEEIQTLRFSVVNIAEEIIGDVSEGYCVPGRTGEFYILSSTDVSVEKLQKSCQRLCRMLNEYLNLSCTVLIGSSEKIGLEGVREAVKRANEAAKYRFYLEHDGVLCWQEDLHRSLKNSYDLTDTKHTLADILISGSAEELDVLFTRLKDDIQQLHLSKSVVQSIVIEVFYVVQDYFARNMLSITDSLPNSYRSYAQLLHMDSLKSFLIWLDALQEDLTIFMNREEEKGYAQLTGKVMDWIAAHYRETATLQEAAYTVGFNPSYLSSLLKKHTGKSYTELLTSYRIQQARDLLLNSDYKVYQIGEMVGYEDKYYFNRIFKKETGMTPGEFKKQKREE